MADAEPALLHQVRRLRLWWERRTRHETSPPDEWMADKLLLDTLGLGLEQAIQHVAQAPRDYDAFLDWIVAVAGAPDPETIARYHAALDGAPLPSATAARLAAIDALPPVLGPDDIAHWDAHGYVILRGAITPAEIEAAAALVWALAEADPGDPVTWHGARQQGMMLQHFQHPALDAARRSPRIHKAFAQLWGDSDLWPRIDRVSFNAPLLPGQGFAAPRLHWDVSLIPPIPFATQGILYLSDTAADQGALELVPGFHHRIEAWLASLGGADPRGVDLSAEAVPIAANAGDLIIWRQDLPHGASPNRAARPRLAQYLNFYSPQMRVPAEWR